MTPTSTSNVRIWWDASIEAYRLTYPYNKDLIEAFKLSVPASDRAFDPQSKIWTFTEKWLSPTVKLIETVTRAKPQVVTRSQAEQASTGGASAKVAPIDTVITQFMRLLPYDAARSAYRKAAILLHPDVQGGDMTKMSALNVAWNRIEKEIYGQ